jgi:CxxC motif-containing protein (DUF1111 family)
VEKKQWLGTGVPVRRSTILPLVLFGTFAMAALFVGEAKVISQTFSRAEDPGVRAGTAGAGRALAGLSAGQTEYFNAGKVDFEESETVEDGLGPRMNLDSCGGCHSQPAVGGSSPKVNPQFAFASLDGALDHVPPFITADGPVREARFVRNPDGTPDGGVHAIFTINGRPGASGCSLPVTNWATQLSNRNVIFRIPTPIFGAGLMEQIPDAALLANQAANLSVKQALGIRGRPNFHVAGRTITGQTNNNGNDGTIARFGWKAQNKSLLIFSGEAYNVEMGITNELFQTERDETKACQYSATPNSVMNTDATATVDVVSSVEKFALFMRFLDQPVPSTTRPGGATSIANGRNLFTSVGCAFCHTPKFTTGKSAVAALSNKTVNLFSDLLIHDMGNGLADGVSQGEAGPREFRTAPLWGLGQRIFFLHDGRTSDLIAAIRAHASTNSEANGVVANFFNLSERQKQDLLNFLRSL